MLCFYLEITSVLLGDSDCEVENSDKSSNSEDILNKGQKTTYVQLHFLVVFS